MIGKSRHSRLEKFPTMTSTVNGTSHWQSTSTTTKLQHPAAKSTPSRVASANLHNEPQPTLTCMLNDPPDGTKDVYDATLPWWRAAIRRRLVRIVERESLLIARMQVCPILENELFAPKPYCRPIYARRGWIHTSCTPPHLARTHSS